MTKRIIQFGTSRFLQVHADLFIHEAREAGQVIGPMLVIKTTSGDDRVGHIVSETIEPVDAIAEPYALSIIKRDAATEIPFSHPGL